MKTRSLLLYVPAEPLDLEALLPQRGLAAMASILHDQGHWTRVGDWGAISKLELLYGVNARPITNDFWRRQTAFSPPAEVLFTPVVDSVVETLGLDFVVFWLPRRAEVYPARAIAQGIKRRLPRIKVAIAGPFANDHGGMLLRAGDEFDCALVEDFELGAAAWASTLQKQSEALAPPNCILKTGRNTVCRLDREPANLAELPLPAYDEAHYPDVGTGQKLMVFTCEQTRGYEIPGRTQPVNRIFAEIEHVRAIARPVALHIAGTASALHVEQFARELQHREYNLRYSRDLDPTLGRIDLLHLLQGSGCAAAFFNIHSGSQYVLDTMYGGRFGVSQADQALRNARALGIDCATDWTYPCAIDDTHSLAETLRLLDRTRPAAARFGLPSFSERTLMSSGRLRLSERSYLRWCRGLNEPRNLGAGWEAPYRMEGWPRWRQIAAQEELISATRKFGVEIGVGIKEILISCILRQQGINRSLLWMNQLLLAMEMEPLRAAVAQVNSAPIWTLHALPPSKEPVRAAAAN